MWDLIVSVPDHCLSFCYVLLTEMYYSLYIVFSYSLQNCRPSVSVRKMTPLSEKKRTTQFALSQHV